MKNIKNYIISLFNNIIVYFKILQLAKNKNLKVIHKYLYYNYAGQLEDFHIITIFHSRLFSFVKASIAISHEIGHHYSYKMGNTWPSLGRDYELLRAKESVSETSVYDVLSEEMSAWIHARYILKSLGFNNWSDFDKFREECLITYFNASKLFDKTDMLVKR